MLIIGTRRRAVTAVASALAAVALALAVGGRGCGVDSNSAEGVARALSEAGRAGDRKAVYELLGPRTRAALELKAKRASDLVGGAQRFTALDLISIGKVAEGSESNRYVVHPMKQGQANVEIIDSAGRSWHILAVKVGDTWRVELLEYVGDA